MLYLTAASSPLDVALMDSAEYKSAEESSYPRQLVRLRVSTQSPRPRDRIARTRSHQSGHYCTHKLHA